MEESEVLDLMGNLEGVGLGAKDAFKVVGSRVPKQTRKAYTYGTTGYTYAVTSPTRTGGSNYENYGSYTQTTHQFEEHEYKVGFRRLFEEHFSARIKELGEDYFYLDTSEKGIPSFTIWGNVSGLVKLKEEIKREFPAAEIEEVPEETRK